MLANTGASPKSPRWTKPSEIMRARQARLTRNRGLSSANAGSSPQESDIVMRSPPPAPASKRVNPFGSMAAAVRRRLITGSPQVKPQCNSAVPSCILLKSLEEAASSSAVDAQGGAGKQPGIKAERLPADLSLPAAAAEDDSSRTSSKLSKAYVPFASGSSAKFTSSGPVLPHDWTLKTCLRLVSSKPFACCAALLETVEEDAALQSSVKPATAKVASYSVAHGSDEMVKLLEGLYYYSYPFLPGFCAFPRMGRKDVTESKPMLSAFMKAGFHNWHETFESAYQRMQKSAGPSYFYLLTHSFTTLFYCTDSKGRARELAAVLSPTTSGLRHALRSGGVTFDIGPASKPPEDATEERRSQLTSRSGYNLRGSRPHEHHASEQISLSAEEPKAHEYDGYEEEDAEDDAHDSWLESLGIGEHLLPGIQMRQSALERKVKGSIDGRPESAIYIRGLNVHSLFKFLIKYPGCCALTGFLAGVPPTILAPQLFDNASVTRVKHRCVRLHSDEGELNASAPRPAADSGRAAAAGEPKESRWMLEVGGPILPCTLRSLLAVAERQQERCYVRLSVLAGTEPFNFAVTPEDDSSSSCCHAGAPALAELASDRSSAPDDAAAAAAAAQSDSGAPAATSSPAAPSSFSTLKELSYDGHVWHWN